MTTAILVFDSGLGGLTVFREVAKARPDASYVYVADDAFFPYGSHGEDELVARVGALTGELLAAHRPDLVVIACNTASTLVLPHLRTRFSVPFVGTVPAIKPACAISRTKRVAVLGTEATVSREYTRALIRDFANGSDVVLVGSARLARFAEDELNGTPIADELIARELAPCFVDADGRRTDTVVLACTHYPARPLRAACALAGDIRRSGARDRAPRRRADRPGSERQAAASRAHRVHLRSPVFGRTRGGAHAFRHC